MSRETVASPSTCHNYCHYDLESTGNGETRYIEVKGHYSSQISGEPTDDEAIFAEKHPDNYWLYIVCNVGYPESTKLLTFKNPLQTMKKRIIETVITRKERRIILTPY